MVFPFSVEVTQHLFILGLLIWFLLLHAHQEMEELITADVGCGERRSVKQVGGVSEAPGVRIRARL